MFVSEPAAYMFGNPEDEPNNKAWTNGNWLKSRFHFSFAEYSSRHNSQFGVLRVMNDDLVQPNRGFGPHGHADMEIVSYIVSGAITHAHVDRGSGGSGTQETLGAGGAQYMTAGTGVTHSEFNKSPSAPLRFIQMWVMPRRRGLKPNYSSWAPQDQQPVTTNDGELFHLVKGDLNSDATAPIQLAQDVNMYVGKFSKPVEFTVREGRMAYLLNIESASDLSVAAGAGCGSLKDGIAALAHSDAAEIIGPAHIRLTPAAGTEAHALVVEMNFDERYSGRSDLKTPPTTLE